MSKRKVIEFVNDIKAAIENILNPDFSIELKNLPERPPI